MNINALTVIIRKQYGRTILNQSFVLDVNYINGGIVCHRLIPSYSTDFLEREEYALSLKNRTAVMTAQGHPRTAWLKTAKGLVVLRPRGMKGFVWDYIVDEKLDVLPDMHFKPKGGLPRILTSDVFYDLRKPLESQVMMLQVTSCRSKN